MKSPCFNVKMVTYRILECQLMYCTWQAFLFSVSFPRSEYYIFCSIDHSIIVPCIQDIFDTVALHWQTIASELGAITELSSPQPRYDGALRDSRMQLYTVVPVCLYRVLMVTQIPAQHYVRFSMNTSDDL